jgi:hypothetical protein
MRKIDIYNIIIAILVWICMIYVVCSVNNSFDIYVIYFQLILFILLLLPDIIHIVKSKFK